MLTAERGHELIGSFVRFRRPYGQMHQGRGTLLGINDRKQTATVHPAGHKSPVVIPLQDCSEWTAGNEKAQRLGIWTDPKPSHAKDAVKETPVQAKPIPRVPITPATINSPKIVRANDEPPPPPPSPAKLLEQCHADYERYLAAKKDRDDAERLLRDAETSLAEAKATYTRSREALERFLPQQV